VCISPPSADHYKLVAHQRVPKQYFYWWSSRTARPHLPPTFLPSTERKGTEQAGGGGSNALQKGDVTRCRRTSDVQTVARRRCAYPRIKIHGGPNSRSKRPTAGLVRTTSNVYTLCPILAHPFCRRPQTPFPRTGLSSVRHRQNCLPMERGLFAFPTTCVSVCVRVCVKIAPMRAMNGLSECCEGMERGMVVRN
jgi:hypothetical protein